MSGHYTIACTRSDPLYISSVDVIRLTEINYEYNKISDDECVL